ncbi:MAG: hypothetical protein Q4B18_00555 [Bacillota bacterium]|nr:hypothetical protein [Bacillota bacterium]
MKKINNIITDAFTSLESNNYSVLGRPDEPMWDEPIMGVAAGDDTYYDFLKEHIGEFHWTPAEAFAKKYKDVPEAKNLRIISVIFPQMENTKDEQNKARVFPCDEWLVSRGEWENVMREFTAKVEAALEENGIRAVAIDNITEFSRQHSENLGIASNWSHRHTAFAAGMGTFGLSDGFITERGKAVRMTSIIVEADLEVTPRGDRGHYDWCLYFRSGICGACIRRCPIRAITEKGHDKDACLAYETTACEKYWPEHIERGDYIFGCGLCQSKVPCRDKRP